MTTRRTIASAAMLLFVGALMHGCGGEPPEEGRRGGVRPDQEIDGFTLTQTRAGVRLWALSAESALVYEDADRVEMTGLRVDYYEDGGEVRSTLTAREGFLERRTSNMEAVGDVVVYAADGTILTTQRLTWNERTGKIESDVFVKVTKGDDVMTGIGVEADPDLKNIRVRSDFKAYVRTPEGELVEED